MEAGDTMPWSVAVWGLFAGIFVAPEPAKITRTVNHRDKKNKYSKIDCEFGSVTATNVEMFGFFKCDSDLSEMHGL